MTRSACEAFRLTFEPGRRGSHFEACAECRTWAQEVESWRSLSARAPLPLALRARLVAIPSQVAQAAPSQEAPAPPATLPDGLRRRLLKIPATERSRQRVLKARHAVAASYLLAGLLTLATSGAGAHRQDAAARGLAEVSARGTQTLRGVGGWILEGCDRANATLEKLFGHLGGTPETPGGPSRNAPPKEDPHGTRKAP